MRMYSLHADSNSQLISDKVSDARPNAGAEWPTDTGSHAVPNTCPNARAFARTHVGPFAGSDHNAGSLGLAESHPYRRAEPIRRSASKPRGVAPPVHGLQGRPRPHVQR